VKRVGVFICHCGINIANTVDVERAARELASYPGVVRAEHYTYMCSDPGQNLIKESIKNDKLDAVVVAACSPNLHLNTFRRASQGAGLNPYVCEQANIREQCSWVHEDRQTATAKAIKLIQGMVLKASRNKPLKPVKVPVTKRALVLGGGISGMQAALDIANSGYETLVIEKNPSIGGHMIQLSETFPTLDCSQCIMTPKMVEVGQHQNIKLYTYSELDDVSGYVGNFKVKIKKKARSVDMAKCTGCGDCTKACLVRSQPEIRALPDAKGLMVRDDIQSVESIISQHGAEPRSLIQVMQDVNLRYRYLPEIILRYISQRLGVSLPEVYHVATFYTAFSLEPTGEHTVKVCVGTACHSRGADQVLEEMERLLGIKAGQTTADLKFSLETVNCLGCCALGPVVVVDDEYHSVKPSKLEAVIGKYE
jgi:heterodisulfide reductase subunit A-like polyferredoxin